MNYCEYCGKEVKGNKRFCSKKCAQAVNEEKYELYNHFVDQENGQDNSYLDYIDTGISIYG